MYHYPVSVVSHLGRISLFWVTVCYAAARPASVTTRLEWVLLVFGSLFGILGISYCSHLLRALWLPWQDLSHSLVCKCRQTFLLATEYSLCLLLASALLHA